ncbi:hypothetical protein BV210_07225 [Halorientalis sp. IM1011]|uniref:DUF7344 domain-containing protein n=1 Tax=Halorientalis sp. IM1011 TaxID=1932360 RepID=UPI00097CD6EF|nr:hypothetical protein [Halorientalis sp. IM1011]AQL42514.1 hypothetical protein BV210_07225 [Halorientalis sp. IM1011]
MYDETAARSGTEVGTADAFSDREGHVRAAVEARGETTVGELAETLATRLDGDRDAATRHEVALVHVHLPKLDAAGLIEYDSESGTVRAKPGTPDPVARWRREPRDGDRSFDGRATSGEAPTPGRYRDRRRTVRSVLTACAPGERTTLSVLAVAVTVSERGGEAVDYGSVRAMLHHVHLPKLDAAGVVDYDPTTRTVRYRGDDFGDHGRDGAATRGGDGDRRQGGGDGSVWTVSGRADARERQRALFDHADESLVYLAATPEMVTDDCLDHLQAAVDRGVAVTLAATTEWGTERIETAVPDLSVRSVDGERLAPLPGDHGRFGRLVLADQRAALVGSRGGDERAVTVEGADHDLVAAIAELVEATDGVDFPAADSSPPLP